MSKALKAQLRWLVGAVTTVRPPRRITKLGGAAVPAEVGLGVYRHAYRARLVECLADDYPALRALIGPADFEHLAHAVIAAHPPREATLNRFGRRLVQYLRAHPGATPHGRLAVDLARLEWALTEAIHAPLAPAFSVADIAAYPAATLASMRMQPAPSLRLITSRWSIDQCYRQQLREEAVTVPPRQAETVAIVRRPAGLQRTSFRDGESRLLSQLVKGRALGSALIASGLTPAAVQHALARMVAAGLFEARAVSPARRGNRGLSGAPRKPMKSA